ncbi:hypothetical protein BO70DRAFT_360217 [Aspergillus heteromorphus CBS 117.55]|uniref:Uncharacterized protein n=1 Tax=Aspergillus heteromorphus CBS 117.55 TaxID=1448321 RepID=A0A317WMK0_9EURO|nr:uncharacterized protein BO70DRAFT_360217 [Aspergillus heteromorphus CBS 117.55]PWY87599.1 hypothetical protein BO70DRAFT_360217 [Aspergillus heteromorphus CBS 117.55]
MIGRTGPACAYTWRKPPRSSHGRRPTPSSPFTLHIRCPLPVRCLCLASSLLQSLTNPSLSVAIPISSQGLIAAHCCRLPGRSPPSKTDQEKNSVA